MMEAFSCPVCRTCYQGISGAGVLLLDCDAAGGALQVLLILDWCAPLARARAGHTERGERERNRERRERAGGCCEETEREEREREEAPTPHLPLALPA